MFVISVRRERVPTPLCVVPDVFESPEPLELEDEPDEEDPDELEPLEDEPEDELPLDEEDPLELEEDPAAET